MNSVLDLSVRHSQGEFALDAALVSDGRLTALFGPSGSGKTSLVNIIAGLVRPQSGHVRIDGETLLDTARGIDLPKHRRRIGYVFQEARLFPHLSVRQNLLFGHWFAPRGSRRSSDLATVLDLLGIGHLLKRTPSALSGGEKQRVAIGRALLSHPRLLLMDEPLAALDEARKSEILPYIERLRDEAGIPIVYVSHSVTEVARLATTVALVEGGRVKACGPTAEVLVRPDLTANGTLLAPSTLLDATVTGRDEAFGLVTAQTPAGLFQFARQTAKAGDRLKLRIVASDVMLSLASPQGVSALNVVAGRIESLAAEGAIVDVGLTCGEARLIARITAKSRAVLGLTSGMAIFAVIKTVSLETP